MTLFVNVLKLHHYVRHYQFSGETINNYKFDFTQLRQKKTVLGITLPEILIIGW